MYAKSASDKSGSAGTIIGLSVIGAVAFSAELSNNPTAKPLSSVASGIQSQFRPAIEDKPLLALPSFSFPIMGDSPKRISSSRSTSTAGQTYASAATVEGLDQASTAYPDLNTAGGVK